jgi:hypothetical protein
MEQENDSVVLHLKNKVITIKSDGLDSEINVDDLLYINYANIFAESVTISTLLHKIGELKAIATNLYEHKKMSFEIFKAERARDYRLKAKDNTEKLTEKALEQMILLDPAYKIECKNLINSQKDMEYCESLYRAVSSKDQKLNILSRSIVPEEHLSELIEQKINSCLVRAYEKKFKES